MGYYLRVLSPSDTCVPASALREALGKSAPGFVLEGDPGGGDWSDLVVRHDSASEEAPSLLLERNSMEDEEELVSEEMDEFLEELQDAQPKSAAVWLSNFLSGVRTVYAVQVLDEEAGAALDAVLETLRVQSKGVTQSDDEGFSNEAGDAILISSWEGATGTWKVAVLDKGGAWRRFEMDVANRAHREAFLRGEVPPAGAPKPR